MNPFKRAIVAVDRLLFGRKKSDLRWWERRAARRGARAVLSLAHTRAEIAAVTAHQKATLFPLLESQLHGSERDILDFGCGTGRFTADLAALVGGSAVGVDPIASLLALAPRSPAVEYRVMRAGRIPANDAAFDVVWICLVLMAITDARALTASIAEIRRVLRSGGLLFVVENTTDRPDLPHLSYRSVAAYQQLLSFANVQPIGRYQDAGEDISVLAGRKP